MNLKLNRVKGTARESGISQFIILCRLLCSDLYLYLSFTGVFQCQTSIHFDQNKLYFGNVLWGKILSACLNRIYLGARSNLSVILTSVRDCSASRQSRNFQIVGFEQDSIELNPLCQPSAMLEDRRIISWDASCWFHINFSSWNTSVRKFLLSY